MNSLKIVFYYRKLIFAMSVIKKIKNEIEKLKKGKKDPGIPSRIKREEK